MNNKSRAAKEVAARKLGMSLTEYLNRIELGEKYCGQCKQWLDAYQNFYPADDRPDGYRSTCKKCSGTKREAKKEKSANGKVRPRKS